MHLPGLLLRSLPWILGSRGPRGRGQAHTWEGVGLPGGLGRDPVSSSPFFPEVVGLRRVPGFSAVCRSSECPHVEVTIFSLACHGAEHVWHSSLTLGPDLELKKYMHRSQRDVFISDCT